MYTLNRQTSQCNASPNNTKSWVSCSCSLAHIYSFTGHLFRMVAPYLKINAGTGIIPTATNPNKLFPHPSPKLRYMLGPANGSTAPNSIRTQVIPAMADAAYCGKESTM